MEADAPGVVRARVREANGRPQLSPCPPGRVFATTSTAAWCNVHMVLVLVLAGPRPAAGGEKVGSGSDCCENRQGLLTIDPIS